MSIPVIDVRKTGKNIQKLILDKNLSVKDVQEILSMQYPVSIYKWMRGEYLPSIDNLVALSAIFGVEIEKILVFK